MLSADQEWENFLNNDTLQDSKDENANSELSFIPKVTPIYISTQTKIGYLNKKVDLNKVFWLLPVINYQDITDGIVKKQIKINCETKEETKSLNEKLSTCKMANVNIINDISKH